MMGEMLLAAVAVAALLIGAVGGVVGFIATFVLIVTRLKHKTGWVQTLAVIAWMFVALTTFLFIGQLMEGRVLGS